MARAVGLYLASRFPPPTRAPARGKRQKKRKNKKPVPKPPARPGRRPPAVAAVAVAAGADRRSSLSPRVLGAARRSSIRKRSSADPKAEKKAEKKADKKAEARARAVRELLETEVKFVRHLQMFARAYVEPLNAAKREPMQTWRRRLVLKAPKAAPRRSVLPGPLLANLGLLASAKEASVASAQ